MYSLCVVVFLSVFPLSSFLQQRLTTSVRTPTLAYTKQLESRVAELEAALSRLVAQEQVRPSSESASAFKNESPSSRTASSSPSRRVIKPVDSEAAATADRPDLAKDFEGLKVERDGRVSFHGPTSLFQLPSSAPRQSSSSPQLVQELGASRERLVNNAWRERAFEQMSAIPV